MRSGRRTRSEVPSCSSSVTRARATYAESVRPEPSRESRLTDAFVGLADSLVSGYDVVDLLHNLIDQCLDLVDASAAGLVLRDQSGALEVLASSTENTQLLELLQLRDGEGPCVECYATGQLVTIDDLSEA